MYIDENGYLVIITYRRDNKNGYITSSSLFEGSYQTETRYKVNKEGLFEEVKD